MHSASLPSSLKPLNCFLHHFNSSLKMWSNLKVLPTSLLRPIEQFTQCKRTTFILKRKHPLRLDEMGATFRKRIKKRGFYYDLVEDTDCKKTPLLPLVLTADVSGIGMRGEKIEMNIYIAYRDLLLPKLAVYADAPEAQNIMKTVEEKQYSSIYSKIVENYLVTQPVQIILSNDVQWTLKPWHIKLALRKNGILTHEDCISIPKEISGPSPEIENKDFLVHITMNKSEVFPLRCRIYFWSTLEPMLNQKSFDLNSPSEALFPDEKEAIDRMIKIEEEIRRSNMIKGKKT